MSNKTKRYLMLLVAVGVIAVAAGGAGTFASFNAEVANTNNQFAAGTLLLHNTSGATTCTSEADSQNFNVAGTGCATLFPTVSVTPGVTTTAPLTLSNAGTLDASGISFALGATCVNTKPTIATLGTPLTSGNAVPATITLTTLNQDLLPGTQIELHESGNTLTLTVTAFAGQGASPTVSVTAAGTANFNYTTAATVSLFPFGSGLCSNLKFYVQEKDGVGGTNVKCVYGGVGVTCPANPSTTLGGIGTTLLPLSLYTTTINGNTAGKLNAKKSRYFVLGVVAPSDLSNTAQNNQVTFDLTWHIDQV